MLLLNILHCISQNQALCNECTFLSNELRLYKITHPRPKWSVACDGPSVTGSCHSLWGLVHKREGIDFSASKLRKGGCKVQCMAFDGVVHRYGE